MQRPIRTWAAMADKLKREYFTLVIGQIVVLMSNGTDFPKVINVSKTLLPSLINFSSIAMPQAAKVMFRSSLDLGLVSDLTYGMNPCPSDHRAQEDLQPSPRLKHAQRQVYP